MVTLTVRDLSDEVFHALRVQAELRGHSMEAEVLDILAAAVKPQTRLRLGDALAALGKKFELANEDFEIFNAVRNRVQPDALEFGDE